MNAIIVLILRLLLLLLAYIFVGWIGYTIFKDLRLLFSNKGDQPAKAIALDALVDQEPIQKQFSKSMILIGRDPDCDFIIPHETISLRHCQLSHHHKQWWAEDLNSTNGSFLNDNMITSAIIITDGDQLRLGNVTISVNINQ